MRYEATVSIKPELTENGLQHYWTIQQITEDGSFTVKHGYASDLYQAFHDAGQEAQKIKDNG